MGLFVNTAKSFLLDMWLARQTPEKVLPFSTRSSKVQRKSLPTHSPMEGVFMLSAIALAANTFCYWAPSYRILLPKVRPLRMKRKGLSSPDLRSNPVLLLMVWTDLSFMGGRDPKFTVFLGTLVGKEDLEGLKVPVTMACTGRPF